jgi:phenylalanyl-tRNA synthetase alpha subunit
MVRPFFFSSTPHRHSLKRLLPLFLKIYVWTERNRTAETNRARGTQAAPDLAALEQTKGAWIGPNGKFTALMKQLGTLSKEEKPAAGKLINAAKLELEAALARAAKNWN